MNLGIKGLRNLGIVNLGDYGAFRRKRGKDSGGG